MLEAGTVYGSLELSTVKRCGGCCGLHLPLNRQSAVYAREAIDLDVSTLAERVDAFSRNPDAAD
jgi:hypothetical protein